VLFSQNGRGIIRDCNKTFTAEFAENAEKKNNGFGITTPGGVVIVYPWFQFLCVSAVKYAR
jgi:hypothetical protein